MRIPGTRRLRLFGALILLPLFGCGDVGTPTCGGFAGLPCPAGLICVDDPSDDCHPSTGADCPGLCRRQQAPAACGGPAAVPCPDGSTCIDDLADTCDGRSDPHCPGLCRQTSTLISCGGFGGGGCAPGFACADDLSDDCLPAAGGDCPGACEPAPPREAPSDCDPRNVTCRVPQPVCEPGFVPSVVGNCYGPCVALESCGCSDDPGCPVGTRCDSARERCAPAPAPPPARPCPAKSACNAVPDENGTCPGECLGQTYEMRCEGDVVHGLCFRRPLPPPAQPATFPAGIAFTPAPMPEIVALDECHDFDFSISNPTAQPVRATISVEASAPYWRLHSTTFANPGELALDPGASLPLSARACAAIASVFDADNWRALVINVNSGQTALHLPIGFGATGSVHCGGTTFPPMWSFAQFERYDTARCCNNVFFPGAQCCTSADCAAGACVDGHCVPRPAANGFVTTPLIGRQRILVALSDMSFPAGANPCENAYPGLGAALRLPEIEGWFADTAARRTRRVPFAFDWYVISGLESRDFVRDGNYTAESFSRALEQHLRSLGCVNDLRNDFDRVVLVSPLLDIPASGIVFDAGLVASRGVSPHHLITHELGHTFGADDLYLDVGGVLQYLPDLMATNRGFSEPQDGVLWGQIGLGDVNDDGVIDLFEFAASPDALAVRDLGVRLTNLGLEVTVGIEGVEDGLRKRIHARQLRIELPDFGVGRETFGGGMAIFSPGEIDLDAIRRSGAVRVAVGSTYWFTDRTSLRRRLTLEHERRVPVTN